jgi:ATP-binding cassette subfamily B protein
MNIAPLLWRLIRYRLWIYLLAVLLETLFQQFRTVFGVINQTFFNWLPIEKHLSPVLWGILLLLMSVAVVRIFVLLAQSNTVSLFAFSGRALLQRNMLERVLEQPGAQALPDSPGEAISRFRDDTEDTIMLLLLISDSISLLVFAIVAFVILFRIDALITVVVFLPTMCVVAIAQAMKKRLEKYRTGSRETTGQVTGAIGEIFSAVQAIQVAGAERHVVRYFHTLNDQRRIAMLKDRVLSTALNTFFDNVTSISSGCILLLVAISVHTAHLGIGDLAIFIYYLALMSGFIFAFGNLLAQYAQTKVSFKRMIRLLQGAPAMSLVAHKPLYLKGPLPELTIQARTEETSLEMLEVRGLSYHYPETERGIENIDLNLKRGSLTVITGRIASGKTTLVRVLLGLLPREGGAIFWNGDPVADLASFFVPPRCAYTPQVPHLFSDTLKENILMGLGEASVDLASAIHIAVMEHDVAELEKGVETVIGPRGVKLSGGQAQRTAAARMLVRNAELLVFDDISSALDVVTEQTLWERIFADQRRTCLVVSHRRAVLQKADTIVVLKDGHIEATGDLEMLLETSEEMRRLWRGDIGQSEE